MKWLASALFLFGSSMSSAADLYIRDESLDSSGAYLVDEIEISPRFMVERFGPPGPGDGIRVSGHYTFRSNEGVVFTIHDYKSTTLWDADQGVPTPEKFWKMKEAVELSIGARGDDASEFKTWLFSEYSTWLKKID